MKKSGLLYVIYVSVIIFTTVYFSVKIIKGDVSLPPFLSGFMAFVRNDAQNHSSGIDEEVFIHMADNLASLPEERKNMRVIRNSEGFKDYEYRLEKRNGTFRIIALGDSFTEGYGVPINDTWPKRLEKKLNQLNTLTQFEVLNFGEGGDDTFGELKKFEEKALKYNPDMVILQFYLNDVWEHRSQIAKRQDELWNMYKDGSFKFPPVVEEKIRELNGSEEDIMYLLMKIAETEFFDYARQKGFENLYKENVESPLTKLINVCKNQKIDLIVIGFDLRDTQFIKVINDLPDFLTKHKVPFFDLTNYLPMGNNDLRLPDMHLSEKGYDILSMKLLEFLLKTNKIVEEYE